MNQYFKFKYIAKSKTYDIFMFVILIVNSIVVIWAGLSNDDYTITILDKIDDISLYFYIAECSIKIIGLGL